MSNDTTASASIDNDPEFQRLVEYWRGEPYGTRSFQNAWDELVAYIDHRAALARAPLPAQSQDAERFRKAIALEDNAEALYAAVLSNAPDADAIRAEFDASIAASLAGKDKK